MSLVTPEDESHEGLISDAVSGDRFALERLLLTHHRRLSSRIARKIPAELNGLVTAEDVGRLNTLDKAFGWGTLRGLDLASCYAVTSGRITSATVEKVSRFGVPLVASKGAVTSLAVEMAEEKGMTLVGFARKARMNVYVGRDRVTLD